jgi:hypothetical protein
MHFFYGARDGIQGLAYAKHTLYLATLSAQKMFLNSFLF